MTIAFDKLPGLDRERLLAVVEPVLHAHAVEGVELVWKTDRGERVLDLTLERPGTRVTGEGITIELCSDISRDLSAALDVADVIGCHYRLQVGSPGVDRALYGLGDYQRFAGQTVRVRRSEPQAEPRVVRGTIVGVTEDRVVLDSEVGRLELALEQIESARLVFEWGTGAGARARPTGSARGRASQRSR